MARDTYQEVTDRVIASLERGVGPWVQKWSGGASLPKNGNSGRRYSGVNVWLLVLAGMLKGFSSPEWFTFNGAKKAGGTVKKGQRGEMVIFYKMLEREAADGTLSRFPMIQGYSVFNREQCEGLPEVGASEVSPFTPAEQAERVISATGADITHGDGRACYIPSADRIQLPTPESFATPADYYSTALHELGHWTGAESRLARDLSGGFGSPSYAREELVAEMAAAFLCASTGIDGALQHPEYIQHWLKVLREDKKAIVSAASQAQKAADYVLSFSGAEASEAADLAA